MLVFEDQDVINIPKQVVSTGSPIKNQDKRNLITGIKSSSGISRLKRKVFATASFAAV